MFVGGIRSGVKGATKLAQKHIVGAGKLMQGSVKSDSSILRQQAGAINRRNFNIPKRGITGGYKTRRQFHIYPHAANHKAVSSQASSPLEVKDGARSITTKANGGGEVKDVKSKCSYKINIKSPPESYVDSGMHDGENFWEEGCGIVHLGKDVVMVPLGLPGFIKQHFAFFSSVITDPEIMKHTAAHSGFPHQNEHSLLLGTFNSYMAFDNQCKQFHSSYRRHKDCSMVVYEKRGNGKYEAVGLNMVKKQIPETEIKTNNEVAITNLEAGHFYANASKGIATRAAKFIVDKHLFHQDQVQNYYCRINKGNEKAHKLARNAAYLSEEDITARYDHADKEFILYCLTKEKFLERSGLDMQYEIPSRDTQYAERSGIDMQYAGESDRDVQYAEQHNNDLAKKGEKEASQMQHSTSSTKSWQRD